MPDISREAVPAVSLKGVTRRFTSGAETVVAVDNVTEVVNRAEFLCIYGASGSGKSTLINLMAALDVADEGTVEVEGTPVASMSVGERADLRLHSVGVVFQDNNLIAEFSGRENVMLPLLARGVSSADAAAEGLRLLELLGVGQLAERRPAEMSGGQRQRVGIARAFAGGRKLLLADEPTGALDSANSVALFDTIRDLCSTSGVTAVVATHDPLARDYATRVWTMRDGALVAQ